MYLLENSAQRKLKNERKKENIVPFTNKITNSTTHVHVRYNWRNKGNLILNNREKEKRSRNGLNNHKSNIHSENKQVKLTMQVSEPQMHTFKPPPFVGIPRMGANRLRSAVIVLLNIVFSDNRNCAATLSLEESFCHITFRTLKVQNPCKRKKLPIVSLVQELYILLLQAIKHNNGADSKGIKKLTTLF